MSDTFDHEADAWDSLNDGYDEPNYSPKSITCKRCGEKYLKWKQLPQGWRLHNYDPGKGLVLHVCH